MKKLGIWFKWSFRWKIKKTILLRLISILNANEWRKNFQKVNANDVPNNLQSFFGSDSSQKFFFFKKAEIFNAGNYNNSLFCSNLKIQKVIHKKPRKYIDEKERKKERKKELKIWSVLLMMMGSSSSICTSERKRSHGQTCFDFFSHKISKERRVRHRFSRFIVPKCALVYFSGLEIYFSIFLVTFW